MKENNTLNRRRFVQLTGAGCVAGFAGCLGDDDEDPSTGDEETSDGNPPSDVAYAFGAGGIVTIDPDEESVTDVDDISGVTWEDIIVTPNHVLGIDSSRNEVHAIAGDGIEEQIAVGSDPNHGFYDETSDEVWVHADGEGAFYVVDANSLDVTGQVQVGLDEVGHGKIAQTGDGSVWVTNTGDNAVHLVDLSAQERIESVDLGHVHGHDDDDDDHDDSHDDHDDDSHDHSIGQHHDGDSLDDNVEHLHGDDDGQDAGTHYVQYSAQSDLVFVERLGIDDDDEHSHSIGQRHDGGSLNDDVEYLHDDDDDDHGSGEVAIVDAGSQEVVGHIDVGGPLYMSPDGSVLAIIDGDHIRFYDATDDHGHGIGSVHLDGAEPDTVRFDDSGDWAFSTNPHSGDVSVIDVDAVEETDRVDLSGDHLGSAPSSTGDGRLVTLGDGTVAFVDMDSTVLESEVDVEVDIDSLTYIE